MPPPDMGARLKILQLKTKDMPLAEDVVLESLARRMDSYSGADIDSVVREAGLYALRRIPEADKVQLKDFDNAMTEVAPSITPEMIKWYQDTQKRFRDTGKPPIDIA